MLGFVLHPSLTFVEVSNSFLPTANTCINRLRIPHASTYLPLPKEEELFNMHDLAVSNTHFGQI